MTDALPLVLSFFFFLVESPPDLLFLCPLPMSSAPAAREAAMGKGTPKKQAAAGAR
eukprot:CAMPEP_0115648920 /NCGR_PEP_ID=MMETSP0272-20121206/40225_1 /TAXON_ID=71861 /ORGANISM="Scrippsiella trochoidea, Strain CCMP3099" /LENGTH=55 /DNA_ID=CAMNT_0003086555 /DNA_START=230 /DNA_END=393 /DNA_ORIENTATION=+